MPTTRLVSADDAPVLAELLRNNREFLAPWEPARDEAYFTAKHQQALVLHALREHAAERMLPQVILDDAAQVVGRITVNGIVRGAFQSASIGYWVGRSHNGRGLATKAVNETVHTVFAGLGLHRLQAETLPHNTASQRVLQRNSFAAYGRAPQYLQIAGEWQDHILYQLLNPHW